MHSDSALSTCELNLIWEKSVSLEKNENSNFEIGYLVEMIDHAISHRDDHVIWRIRTVQYSTEPIWCDFADTAPPPSHSYAISSTWQRRLAGLDASMGSRLPYISYFSLAGPRIDYLTSPAVVHAFYMLTYRPKEFHAFCMSSFIIWML